MISESGDEEYGMQCFTAEFHEKSGLVIDQVNTLECGIRWAVEARRREKGEQQEQRRQGGQKEQWRQGEQREQSAEERVEGWIWQGEEETRGGEDEHGRREGTDGQGREREGIESENDTGKEDWGDSLERKRVGDIRHERSERGRVNWNSGRQVRLTGCGQDHWEGEMRNWYQDQWWDSRSWGGKLETKGFGRMERHWRRSKEKLQSDGGSTSKGEGGCSGSENENRWGRPKRREGRGLEIKMMTWPDWPEEMEIAANKEISEEIQAGTSDEIRRISDRCEDEAAVSVKESEEIQMERGTRRKREKVVAREIEEILGGESLEEIREEEEEKLEWEREKQIREQLIEADRVRSQAQAALERKGKRGMDILETERKDWDWQAVERQMALAEQREKHRIDEGGIGDQRSGGGKQGIGGRVKLTGVIEEGNEEHGARNVTIGEKGSCFQLSSETDGSVGEGKLEKTVRMLEEKIKEMNSRICVLEGNSDGEEKETSSSDGGYEKDWRWDNGGWWLRAPLIKGNRVNARYRRKISRMVRQMLNQEEKKGGRQKWDGRI